MHDLFQFDTSVSFQRSVTGNMRVPPEGRDPTPAHTQEHNIHSAGLWILYPQNNKSPFTILQMRPHVPLAQL